VFGSDTHWNFWIKTNTVDNVLDTRAAMLVCSGKGNPGNENSRSSSPGKAIPQRGLIHTGVGVGNRTNTSLQVFKVYYTQSFSSNYCTAPPFNENYILID